MVYSLAEVAKNTNIEERTLKYYAKEGLLPRVAKTSSGVLKFSKEDFYWLELITSLRNTGVSLSELKELAKIYSKDKNGSSFTDTLLKYKADSEKRLAEFEKNINNIDKFIVIDKEISSQKAHSKTLAENKIRIKNAHREKLLENFTNALN